MRAIITIFAAATLISCGQPVAVDNNIAGTDSLPRLDKNEASATGGPPANVTAHASAQSQAAAIPTAIQGRWGLSPGDCTSTRGDAKGLLVIGPDDLKFYESLAVPADGVQTSPNSINGNFNFTGEGQEWTRHTTLELREGKLVRTERDPIASFTYVRC